MTLCMLKGDLRIHEVAEVTESGNYLTACSSFGDAGETQEIVVGVADCPGCVAPVAQELLAPRRTAPRASAKPQWRQARNLHQETVQSIRFAHKAIVGALEWLERGAENQFTAQALDQVNLAYRFLRETLVTNGRIEDDSDDYTE